MCVYREMKWKKYQCCRNIKKLNIFKVENLFLEHVIESKINEF